MQIKIRKRKSPRGSDNNRKGKNKASDLSESQRALELRIQGQSYRTIAKELDLSLSKAYRHVNKELKILQEKVTDKAEQLRTIEITRLDKILRKLIPFLEDKDPYIVGTTAEKILKVMDRRAKYIRGLDVAVKQEFGLDEDIKEMFGQAEKGLLQTLKRLAGEED